VREREREKKNLIMFLIFPMLPFFILQFIVKKIRKKLRFLIINFNNNNNNNNKSNKRSL
jgi:hypothetical protein